MKRNVRQSKILDIISSKEIGSQEELISELKKLNFDINQSTVSRDIKELGLNKVALDNGKSKYVYLDFETETARIATKYVNIFKEAVLSVDVSENLIVMKALSGTANAVGIAVDKLNISGILGSVAGDDTLMIIARSKEESVHIADALNKILLSD